ncbi:MAG: primosomal protein N', partial [Bacteroidota bacterium]
KNELCCHYCGFKRNPVTKCEACGSTAIQVVGFGTEKIEDELKTFFPEVKVGRMDADNIRTRSGHDKIIGDFEEKKLHVLVGTQMVAKGLDFDHVSLVGVMNADQLLMFPDFRSAERAYQMIEQVSGRAGRKNYAGKVIVQTERPEHYVLQFVQQRDYKGFYNHELLQRQSFGYPPYTRLIKLSFKHKEQHRAQAAAIDMAKALAPVLQHRLLGPAEPYINRIKNQYIIELLCKLEKNQALIKSAKETIMQERDYILAVKGNHAIQIEVNVDPF